MIPSLRLTEIHFCSPGFLRRRLEPIPPKDHCLRSLSGWKTFVFEITFSASRHLFCADGMFTYLPSGMDLPQQLLERIARLEPPNIIAVSGFGGAGKSSFASMLGSKIVAPVVGIDSFITDRTMSRYARWEIMDFDRLEREVLCPFTEGRLVRYGHFDWGRNAIGEYRELPPTERMIVEGVGLLRPNLLKYFSLSIWVDCPIHEAIKRGKRRDREEYKNPQDEAWDGIWKQNDEECYDAYRPKVTAHCIVSNFDPETNKQNTLSDRLTVLANDPRCGVPQPR